MLTPNGSVKLMDFGIARLSADRRLTQTGRTVGSLYYMSPEQIQGALDLDARSDLYSLGVTLYEMVTARRPFQGDSDYSIMAAHLSAHPVPPVEIDPSLPAMLNDVILMAIAKEPAQRFQTADALRTALESAGGVPAPKPGPEPQTKLVPPLAAVPAPVSLPQNQAEAAPRNRRGLYMAIGSVATVAILAFAALQAPRLFRSSSASSVPPSSVPHSASPVSSSPVSGPVEAQTVVSEPEKQPAASVKATGALPAGKRSEKPQKALSTPVADRPPAGAAPAQVAQNQVFTPTTAQTYPQSSAPAQTTPVDTARQEALQAQRELLMLLGTRANSMKASLATMKQQQQARMGVNLRSDITAAEQRMEFYLDDAEGAIKTGDPEHAKKSLSLAERAIDVIEKFLGR
jgi:serine/threonine-protein kinase